VGKTADLVVVARSLFAISPYQIGTTPVLLTLFEGHPVFGSLDSLQEP
jgi:predicted amidohydrolase YtcJ